MEQNPEQQPSQQEESIFKEEELLDAGYYKQVKQARNAIYIVAGVQFVFGMISSFTGPDELMWINFGIMSVIALIFLLLGLWAGTKPYPAILIALILYLGLNLLDLIYDPASFARGLIMKIFIVVYLVKGLTNANKARLIKNALSTK